MYLLYFSPVELVINQDVEVVIMVVKMAIIHQHVADIVYAIMIVNGSFGIFI